MSCKDVMIVEDDKDIREGFVTILEQEGYKVLEAENGQAALDILHDRREKIPGCIILDLVMPVMDGRTFLETLKKDHPDDLCKIPIILATAVGSSFRDDTHLPCMVEEIAKPLDISELIGVVKKHCGEVSL